MTYHKKIKKIIEKVQQDYKSRSFIVVMEDDFLARVYYHLLSENFNGLNTRVFVKTRILQDNTNLPKNKKYDLVIGEAKTIYIPKKKVKHVIPIFIGEFKVFPIGFSPQQLSRRRRHIADDIVKLNMVASRTKGQEIELSILFFDEIGWLNGRNRNSNQSRLKEIIEKRNQVNRKIQLLGILNGEVIES
jgi:hypothetical protein